MPIGGGFKLAEAYVEIVGDSRKYDASIGRARDSLGRFVANSSRELVRFDASVGRARDGLGRFVATGSRQLARIEAGGSGAASSFGRLGASIGGLVPRVGGLGGLFGDLERSLIRVGRVRLDGLFLLATAGAAGLGGAVRQAIRLESAYSQLRKTTNLEGAALEAVRGRIEGLATSLAGVSLGELLEIATIGGRLGVAGDGIADFTRDLAKMKVALVDIPVEELTTRVARILNVFQLGTDRAINFGSALNKLDDSTTATGREILDVTQRLAGGAKAMGITAQETLALAAAIKDAGISSEVGGTAFSQIFEKINLNAAEFAAAAGVTEGAFSRLVDERPLEAIRQFLSGLQRFDKQGQSRALKSLGLEGARVVGSLRQLSSVLDRIPGYVAIANDEWRTLASIEREVAIQGGTTGAQLGLLANNAQLTAKSIGEVLTPAVGQLAGVFNEVNQDVRAGLEDQSSAVARWREGFVAAIEYLGVIYRNFGDVFEHTGVTIAAKIVQVVDTFEAFGSYLRDNWLTILGDVFRTAVVMAANFGRDVADVLRAVLDHLADPFRAEAFDWEGLKDKLNSNVDARDFLKTPKFVAPGEQGQFAAERAAIEGRMAAREDDRLARVADRARADAAAKAPDGAVRADGAARGIPFEGGGRKNLGAIIGAGQFDADLAQAVVGGKEDKVVETIEQGNAILGAIRESLEQQRARVVAAVFG